MKLRNKKNGEIVFLENARVKSSNQYFSGSIVLTLVNEKSLYNMEYSTLESIMEEWEDYEEPEEVWYIDFQGMVRSASKEENNWFKESEIGNYFETKEEAEKAVEKLKAWKRLRDKGFKFEWWLSEPSGDHIEFYMDSFEWDKEATEDLNLLFGGKEWINSEL